MSVAASHVNTMALYPLDFTTGAASWYEGTVMIINNHTFETQNG